MLEDVNEKLKHSKHMHMKSNVFPVVWSERCKTVIKNCTANAPRALKIEKTENFRERERER